MNEAKSMALEQIAKFAVNNMLAAPNTPSKEKASATPTSPMEEVSPPANTTPPIHSNSTSFQQSSSTPTSPTLLNPSAPPFTPSKKIKEPPDFNHLTPQSPSTPTTPSILPTNAQSKQKGPRKSQRLSKNKQNETKSSSKAGKNK